MRDCGIAKFYDSPRETRYIEGPVIRIRKFRNSAISHFSQFSSLLLESILHSFGLFVTYVGSRNRNLLRRNCSGCCT